MGAQRFASSAFKIGHQCYIVGIRCSSVYRLGWTSGEFGRDSCRNKRFSSLLHSVQTGPGAHPDPNPMGTGGCFLPVKTAGAWSWSLIRILTNSHTSTVTLCFDSVVNISGSLSFCYYRLSHSSISIQVFPINLHNLSPIVLVIH
jgi:hypothetical protein